MIVRLTWLVKNYDVQANVNSRCTKFVKLHFPHLSLFFGMLPFCTTCMRASHGTSRLVIQLGVGRYTQPWTCGITHSHTPCCIANTYTVYDVLHSLVLIIRITRYTCISLCCWKSVAVQTTNCSSLALLVIKAQL